MRSSERLKSALYSGAIGDALGRRYEGKYAVAKVKDDLPWQTSDDTQLTLATCEAICDSTQILPEKIADRFLYWYNTGKLTGVGMSTLSALRKLQVGAHWALAGREGNYAAGNGAAMRIAPLAFKENVSRETVRDICRITHKNDEAYVGALAVYYSIRFALNGTWNGDENLIPQLVELLPDTLTRDRLMEMIPLSHLSISEIGEKFHPTGYVVQSVPVSIFAAQKSNKMDFRSIIHSLITIGGDTDTTCSMTGQILGALNGMKTIPQDWLQKLQTLEEVKLIDKLVHDWIA